VFIRGPQTRSIYRTNTQFFVVEELIDEFFGLALFSKIDLCWVPPQGI